MPFQKGNPGRPRRPISERFWPKVALPDGIFGCWEWLGTKTWDGYGHFRRPGTEGMIRAHRLTYEQLYGQVPEGLQLDHLCRNRGCVNPGHLEAVTSVENRRRGVQNGPVKTTPYVRPRATPQEAETLIGMWPTDFQVDCE